MRKVFCLIFALTLVCAFSLPLFAADSQTVNGWVVDSKCGAKSAHEGAAECVKKCLAAGAHIVVVTDSDKKVLNVSNPDALKGHEGHHVAVTGKIDGDNIHVDSAKML